MNYIDLFAGAGGLSEGFIRAGYKPIAHVESDQAACFTLKTRLAYHHLKEHNKLDKYYEYLKGEISRSELYSLVPAELLDTVINKAIGENNKEIFSSIDQFTEGKPVDMIIGGPPCQAYSYIGRAALKHRTHDERNTLYIHYGRFLKRYEPTLFVFENVPGLLTAGKGNYFRNLRKYYKRLGYNVEAKLLNAKEHDVIQNRERVIIIGWKKTVHFSFPEIHFSSNGFLRDDIFGDLPEIGPGENRRIQKYSKGPCEYLLMTEIRNGLEFVSQHITRPHNTKDLKIYELAIDKLSAGIRLKNNNIPKEIRTQKNIEDFLDRFKVVDNLPHTMIAHIAKDGHHFIHPDKMQLRSISVREAARIQSFPDDFYFEGIKEDQTRTAAFRQIGNAVPPILAGKIACSIVKELQNL
ncbi:MAG: DNA cytosine methyltransferase [Bacteroidetes bacterium]|nr:DNA cytosine methyltransferase [Bacteroidota bacterium]MBU1720484.1 DNA cytosine methyltransferase [Bacteroidota bacterium]